MPELPEVETIRLGLEKYIVDQKILSIESRASKIFSGDVPDVIDATFKNINRFGKVLSLDLDNGKSLVIHVKMTGQLIYGADGSKVSQDLPHKFTHVIFRLDKGTLFYNDIRRFGWIKIVETSKLAGDKFLKGLGPEPLKDLTLEKFKEILKKSKTKIKPLLMDQSKIGGVGNIYANDALFAAGINPARPSTSLSPREAEKLFKELENVLKKGLLYGGSSENTYVNVLGEKGSYQEHALVYGKAGERCPNCGTEIKRISLGGRGTFLCPNCQK